MTAPTINRVNAALTSAGLPLEIVRGKGYFWFAATDGAPMGVEDYVDSLWFCQLRCMSVEQYVAHVTDGVAKFKSEIIG